VDLLDRTARAKGLTVEEATWPMRWSDDFGHFAGECPSLYFGLGLGEHVHPLHHPQYEFEDSQIMTGTRLFEDMVRTLLRSAA
jgi:metal-dependent amidase/aminoacylase/carboxypeptidase family protein